MSLLAGLSQQGDSIADAQPLDSDLTALAGLSTTGLVARTGAGTAVTRTITGTANQITVTNGDGVAGNPTLALPQSIATSSMPTFAGLSLGDNSGIKLSTYRDGSGGDIGFGINLSGAPAGWEHSIYAGGQSDTNGRISFGRRRGDTGTYTERMVVDVASGNVGIGTTAPSAQLHVAGGNVRFSNYGAGTLVTDSSGNITASSDASLKTVTGSFTRGLADVLKLTPRTYRWKESSGMNTEDENVGFIAQEVLESIPEAVGQYRTSEVEVDGKKTKNREKAELLTLSDRPLIAALVNAVRELNEKNAALEARVSVLENGKAAK